MIIKKLFIIFLMPLFYPIHLIAKWYEAQTTYGKSFSATEETVAYWSDFKEAIFYKEE